MTTLSISKGLEAEIIDPERERMQGLRLLRTKQWHRVPLSQGILRHKNIDVLREISDHRTKTAQKIFELMSSHQYGYATCQLEDRDTDVPAHWDEVRLSDKRIDVGVTGHLDTDFRDHATCLYYPWDRPHARPAGTWIADPVEMAQRARERLNEIQFGEAQALRDTVRDTAEKVIASPDTIHLPADFGRALLRVCNAAKNSGQLNAFWGYYFGLLRDIHNKHIQLYLPGTLLLASGRKLHGRMPLNIPMEGDQQTLTLRRRILS